MKKIPFSFRIIVFLLSIILSAHQINASPDQVSDKFAKNQSEFEKSIAPFNFQFAEGTMAKLHRELSHEAIKTRSQEIIKTKQGAYISNEEAQHIEASSVRQEYLKLKIGIISDLENNRLPKLEDVFNALLMVHYLSFGNDIHAFNAFRSSINQLVEANGSSVANPVKTDSRFSPLLLREPFPIQSFKVTYEKNIADTHHYGQPLLYNVDASSLAHPLLENRVQCYSGSLLFFVLSELAGLTGTPRFAIFKKGHILPGVLNNNGDQLYGIESTVKGKGIVNFGSVARVSGDIRVVEVYPFLLVELLKDEIANFPDLYRESQNALRKYGFSTENFHLFDPDSINPTNNLQVLQSENTHSHRSVLNNSPFGFGTVEIPPNDMERIDIDEVLFKITAFNRSWLQKWPQIRVTIHFTTFDEPTSIANSSSEAGQVKVDFTFPDSKGKPSSSSHVSPHSIDLATLEEFS